MFAPAAAIPAGVLVAQSVVGQPPLAVVAVVAVVAFPDSGPVNPAAVIFPVVLMLKFPDRLLLVSTAVRSNPK